MDLLGPRDSFTLQRDVRRSVSRLSEKRDEILVTEGSATTNRTTIDETPTAAEETTTRDMERTITPTQLEAAIPESSGPRNWSRTKKIAITAFVLASTFVATLGTPIYIASIPDVTSAFDINTTLATAPTSFYTWGVAFGALLGTASSDGRAVLYRASLPLAFAFTLIGGSAQNFAVLATGRSFTGLFSGSCLSVGVGVIIDLWDGRGRLGALVGFVLVIGWANIAGPIISSAILHSYNWRWTFWIHALLLGIAAAHAFIIPETHYPQILRSRAQISTDQQPSFRLLFTSLSKPLRMLLTEPVVSATGLVTAITQSTLYALYPTYPHLLTTISSPSPLPSSLAFTPILIGSFISLPTLWTFNYFTYRHSHTTSTVLAPEKRLFPAMLGVVLLPISIFWLALTGREDIPSLVPQASGLLFGVTYVLNILPLVLYNNDVYGISGVVGCVFMQFLVSAPFPLFMGSVVERLGFKWAVCTLGFVAVGCVPVPCVLWWWGERLRARSVYLRDERRDDVVEL